MHSTLRKIGSATWLIVPKAVLREAGVESGMTLDLFVEDGRIVAIPMRVGWAGAATVSAGALASED